MAEIEYKGIKVGGSKLLLVVPLVGTIIGGLWGGFELFNRYQMMEKKIDSYVAPDLSGFDKRLEVVQQVLEVLLRLQVKIIYKPLDLLILLVGFKVELVMGKTFISMLHLNLFLQ